MQLFALLSYIWGLIFGFAEEERDGINVVIRRFMELFCNFDLVNEEGKIIARHRETLTCINFYEVDDWFVAKIECDCHKCPRSKGIHHIYFREEDSSLHPDKTHLRGEKKCIRLIATTIHEREDGSIKASKFTEYVVSGCAYDYHFWRKSPVILHAFHHVVVKYNLGERHFTNNEEEFAKVMNDEDHGLNFMLRMINVYKGVKSARK